MRLLKINLVLFAILAIGAVIALYLLGLWPTAQSERADYMFWQCTVTNAGLTNWSIDPARNAMVAYRTVWNADKNNWDLPDGPFDVTVANSIITLERTRESGREVAKISMIKGSLEDDVIPQSSKASHFTGDCRLIPQR